jgi:hypothetical protein
MARGKGKEDTNDGVVGEKKEDNTSPSSKKEEFKLKYNIETPNGVYTVKRPVGRAGVIHFTLVSKSIPTTVDPETGETIVSPGDQERFVDAFVEWTTKVLPTIYVSGPVPVEDMPGEDQYALFLAMFSTVNLGGSDLFRFID